MSLSISQTATSQTATSQTATATGNETGINFHSELKASREPRLLAKWLLVNNKLVCQWIIN